MCAFENENRFTLSPLLKPKIYHRLRFFYFIYLPLAIFALTVSILFTLPLYECLLFGKHDQLDEIDDNEMQSNLLPPQVNTILLFIHHSMYGVQLFIGFLCLILPIRVTMCTWMLYCILCLINVSIFFAFSLSGLGIFVLAIAFTVIDLAASCYMYFIVNTHEQNEKAYQSVLQTRSVKREAGLLPHSASINNQLNQLHHHHHHHHPPAHLLHVNHNQQLNSVHVDSPGEGKNEQTLCNSNQLTASNSITNDATAGLSPSNNIHMEQSTDNKLPDEVAPSDVFTGPHKEKNTSSLVNNNNNISVLCDSDTVEMKELTKDSTVESTCNLTKDTNEMMTSLLGKSEPIEVNTFAKDDDKCKAGASVDLNSKLHLFSGTNGSNSNLGTINETREDDFFSFSSNDVYLSSAPSLQSLHQVSHCSVQIASEQQQEDEERGGSRDTPCVIASHARESSS